MARGTARGPGRAEADGEGAPEILGGRLGVMRAKKICPLEAVPEALALLGRTVMSSGVLWPASRAWTGGARSEADGGGGRLAEWARRLGRWPRRWRHDLTLTAE
jgi:hypothetical protein